MQLSSQSQNIFTILNAEGLSTSLGSEDRIPLATFWRKHEAMPFDEATRIAAKVQYLADFPVHFHQLTGDALSLFLFDPEPAYSSVQLGNYGTPVAEWIAAAMELPSAHEPGKFVPFSFDYQGKVTECPDGGFVWARRPFFESTSRTGKWCVMVPEAEVDALWEKVSQAVAEGSFASALVSTPAQARQFQGTYLVCAFNIDWLDFSEVRRNRELLRSFGVSQDIGYKRDIETHKNVYSGAREWTYRG